jgi:prepilin-type N-terminal cleavage/methylation domain-containing protein
MLNKKGSVPIKNGFTLVEILIAIFILTTVLTTIYAAYTGTFRIVKDTQYTDDIYSMARRAMKRMTVDLESVCSYRDSFKFATGEIEKEDLAGSYNQTQQRGENDPRRNSQISSFSAKHSRFSKSSSNVDMSIV